MKLQGKCVAIIGGASEIGSACIRMLCEHRARVLIVDLDSESLRTLSTELGDQVETYCSDVASLADVRNIVTFCRKAARLDAVIYARSAMETWPETEDTFESMQRTISDNLIAPAMCTRELAPLLAESGGGSIVYLGSIDGLRGNPNVPAYSMGKGGLVALTHLMAQRLGASGIRINCVATGAIAHTPFTEPARRVLTNKEQQMRLTPLGRMPSAREIASVLLFLVADDSSYVSGTVIPVDGGRIAGTPGSI